MIQALTVENIAIIDRSEVQFASGFTALTGETGAGKSLLIDAIGLALGGRADSDLVRSGAIKGIVSVLADLRANPMALAKCAQHGVDIEGGQLVVHREISAEGRSTVRLNGKLAAVGTLRDIGALLVDLHGQHDHQSLLQTERQIEFLDAWIGDEAHQLLVMIGEGFSEVELAKRQLQSIRTGRREREQRLDMLRFQAHEIEEAQISVSEMDDLTQRRDRLKNSEKLRTGIHAGLERLTDLDSSALDQLRAALHDLETLAPLDPSLDPILAPVREAFFAVQESGRELRVYLEDLDSDPSALEETAARIDLLQRLRRKYGDTEEIVLAYLGEALVEISILENSEGSETELEEKLTSLQQELQAKADALTQLRGRSSTLFSKEVGHHIKDLAMEKAKFDVRLERGVMTPAGQDRVEFFFSANPGEESRALARVASGGELSRIMLSIKIALAGRGGVPTLIFDEVDTGLSGRVAAVTARKLEELAQFYQVIVISHLPQIAGRAEHHFRIEKLEKSGRVLTQVRRLRPPERVEEIARMLAGETVSESAMANARELLSR